MNTLKRFIVPLMQPAKITLVVMIIVSIFLAFLAYRLVSRGPHLVTTNSLRSTVLKPRFIPTPSLPEATQTPIVLPPEDVSKILGVDVSTDTGADKEYPGISWLRMAYPNCGNGDLRGQKLRDTIQHYHSKGMRVFLVVCQSNGMDIGSVDFNDIAQARPDGVQCGNEEMKQDPSVGFLYMPPDQFARFYDLCEHAVHAVNPQTPTLMGSLDPHVAGPDYLLMAGQANYLDQMQQAMNAVIHPGGNWDWHNQTLGVIDSWHNGYFGANNLAGVLDFWAQQFHVARDGGELGKHVWVVEATGCYKGCGLNVNDPAQLAIAHTLTLITDVQTATQANIPHFYFSGKDIASEQGLGPTGVLDVDGHPKPLREDLGMGSRTLTFSCPDGSSPVIADQEQLLAKLYSRCSPPSNYVAILSS